MAIHKHSKGLELCIFIQLHPNEIFNKIVTFIDEILKFNYAFQLYIGIYYAKIGVYTYIQQLQVIVLQITMIGNRNTEPSPQNTFPFPIC